MAEQIQETAFLLVWKNPQKAIRKALLGSNKGYSLLFAVVYGLQQLLLLSNQNSMGLNYHYTAVLGLCLLVSFGYGLVWLNLSSVALFLITKVGGSAASFHENRLAAGWSRAPFLITVFMWLMLLVFTPDFAFIKIGSGPTFIFLYMIILIVTVWSLILLILMLQEVHQFSTTKAIISWLFFFPCSLIIDHGCKQAYEQILTFF